MKKTMSTQFTRHSGFLLVILLLGAALNLTMVHGTEAATLYVSPTGKDTGDCQSISCATIQYAISKASGDDTIKLAQGTYTEAGISIDKNLTLQGDSATNTIIQAAITADMANARVFTIKSDVTVNIQKVTIKHGKASYGGGIFIGLLAKVTINDSTISHNSAEGEEGFGGGILLDQFASLTLNNSTLSHNKAIDNGGGIYSFCFTTITVKNSTISSNSASVNGGGIHTGSTPPSTLTITDSTISNNFVVHGGGGILNTDKATISNSTISENGSSLGYGGGIANLGTLSLINDIVINNGARRGGGIENHVIGKVTIRNSTIYANGAYHGGGIDNSGTMSLINSTISYNSANWGGAIANYPGTTTLPTLTISNSTLANNRSYAVHNEAAGIANAGIVNIKSTIIANSLSGGVTHGLNCFDSGGAGKINASGTNLATDNSCKGFTQVTSTQLNLGSLLLNLPGSTPTHSLLPKSVAINAAADCKDFNGNPVTTDQRGVARPYPAGGKCDVGAYETNGVYKTGSWPMNTEGGIIPLPDGTVSIIFPPGAVPDDVLVVIERPDDDLVNPPVLRIPPSPEGWQRVGAAYDLRVYDVEGNQISAFHRPVELILRYNPEEVDGNNEQSMVIHFYEPEIAEWVPLPSEVDPDEHTVTSSTERPGLFGLFGVSESPEVFDSPLIEERALDTSNSLDGGGSPITNFEESSELMPSSIPEPATVWILGIGLGVLIVIKRIINTRK